MRILVIKLIRRAQRSAAARPWFDCVFRVALLPVFVRLFRLMRLDDMWCCPVEVSFASVYAKAMKVFSTPAGERRLRNDVIACFLYYQVSPEEYFMYGFAEKPHAVRKTYLSNMQRFYAYVAGMGWEPYLTLRDKVEFSKLARPYFRRETCPLAGEEDFPAFADFCSRHGRFFLKPNEASLGSGCRVVDHLEDPRPLFDDLLASGTWIAEELVVQSAEMEAWNPSSVNTVRINSFRKDGDCLVHTPFLRVGRKGSIVDNGGAGGVFCSIDAETGVVATDGYTERGDAFKEHPDSGQAFKGEQIPHWKELLALSREIHLSLPEAFRYVGFDFALTDAGWVLIEGNWGQYVAQQVTWERGMKQDFESLMQVSRLEAIWAYQRLGIRFFAR